MAPQLRRKPETIEEATLSNIKKAMAITTFQISAEMMSTISDIARNMLDGYGTYASKPVPETFNSAEGRDWLDQAVIDIGDEFKRNDIPLRLDTPMKAKAMKGCFYYLRQNKVKRKWTRALRDSTRTAGALVSNSRHFTTCAALHTKQVPTVAKVTEQRSSGISTVPPVNDVQEHIGQPVGPCTVFSPSISRSISPDMEANSTIAPVYVKPSRDCPCLAGPARIMDHTRIKLQNRYGQPIDSCLASEITGFNTKNPHFLEDQAFMSLQGLFMEFYEDMDPTWFRFEWWDPVDQHPKAVTCARHLRLAVQTMLSATGNEFFLFRCSPDSAEEIHWNLTCPPRDSAIGSSLTPLATEKAPDRSPTDEAPRKRVKMNTSEYGESPNPEMHSKRRSHSDAASGDVAMNNAVQGVDTLDSDGPDEGLVHVIASKPDIGQALPSEEDTVGPYCSGKDETTRERDDTKHAITEADSASSSEYSQDSDEGEIDIAALKARLAKA